jgi:hypothetical protein
MVKVCLNLNDTQKEIWERYKVFIKDTNCGAFYGHLSSSLCEALLLHMENRTHRSFSTPEEKKKISAENKRFLDIWSYDDKENVYNSYTGMPVERFELLLGKIYTGVSESTFRNKIKEILRLNNLVLVEDEVNKNKFVYSRSNTAGISFRSVDGKQELLEQQNKQEETCPTDFLDSMKGDNGENK